MALEVDPEMLETALKSIPELLAKRQKALDEREKELEDQRKQLEIEKEQMGVGFKPSNVIHLNVGGDTTMAVLRKTLTSVEGSMLAARFSGRWDDSLEKDKDGNFFINQPIELFRPMINYLRYRECETPRSLSVKSPDAHFFRTNDATYADFLRMVEYYGMTPGIYPTQIILHCGMQDDSTINGHSVISRRFSTFTLEPSGHSRRIQSFEVILVETETFQIGWINKEKWGQETASSNDIGVAEGVSAIGLDLVRHKVRYEKTVKTLESDFSIGKGTVVRCELQASDSKPTWYINDDEIESGGSIPSSFVPAFSGKGEWRVSSVELFP